MSEEKPKHFGWVQFKWSGEAGCQAEKGCDVGLHPREASGLQMFWEMWPLLCSVIVDLEKTSQPTLDEPAWKEAVEGSKN